jgi:anti-sigma B factor antagonist
VTDDQQTTRALARPAVVTLPAKVDTAASRSLCGQLGSALASADIVIADMTATKFCDSSGVHILLLAQEQAAATGVEMRLVVRSAAVLRALAAMGADWLLPVYPTLEDALASGAAPQTGGNQRKP